MFKKFTIAFGLVTLLTLSASSLALAQDEPPPQPGGFGRGFPTRGQRLLGEITSLGEGEIHLRTLRGEERLVRVNAATQYRDKGKNALEFADLKEGRWVGIIGPRGGDAFVAKLVLLLPEDFDPSTLEGRKMGGKVLSVNAVASSLTLETRKGETVTLAVDAATKFDGDAQSLAELEPGMLAGVVAEESEEGALLAKRIASRWPIEKHAGTVKSVDTQAGTFTLATRQGDELVYTVEETTRFRSKDGQVSGLEDLQAGILAVVTARSVGGKRVAALVLAGDKAAPPEFDRRFAGKVAAVGAQAFTLELRDGSQVEMTVNSDTLFRSPLDKVPGLEQLKEGMVVLVWAQEVGEGEYLAVRVVAGRLAWLKMPRLWRAP